MLYLNVFTRSFFFSVQLQLIRNHNNIKPYGFNILIIYFFTFISFFFTYYSSAITQI